MLRARSRLTGPLRPAYRSGMPLSFHLRSISAMAGSSGCRFSVVMVAPRARVSVCRFDVGQIDHDRLADRRRLDGVRGKVGDMYRRNGREPRELHDMAIHLLPGV